MSSDSTSRTTATQALLLLGSFGAGCLITVWWTSRRELKLREAARHTLAQSPRSSAYSTPSVTPRSSMNLQLNRQNSSSSHTALALVVRSDLKLGKATIGVQCAHAALGAFKKLYKKNYPALKAWEEEGAQKVCLRVEGEEEIMQLRLSAQAQGLPTFVVTGSGSLNGSQPTPTVLALGPGDSKLISQVTSHLTLLS